MQAFGLQQDGKFSYTVHSDVTRMYMRLAVDCPKTSGVDLQRVIGASSAGAVTNRAEPSKPKRRVQSMFVVEGEDISNVVFEVLAIGAQAVARSELRQMIRQEAAAINFFISDDELYELAGEEKH